MFSIDSYNFSGKKVLLRVDFNVPLNEENEVTDTTRIVTAIPTIQKLLAEGASVVILTHLGRPKGKRNFAMSLQHLVPVLEKLLDRQIKFSYDCVGENTQKLANCLQPGEVLLLENLRFHEEEMNADESFAQELAGLGDVYVNDAFGTAHRAHASTYTIAQYFPNDKMFGYLVESEIKNIDKVVNQSERPFTAIIGGSKVSTKIHIIEALLDRVDNLIIGGGIVYSFIKAQGGSIGNSLVEDDFVETVKRII